MHKTKLIRNEPVYNSPLKSPEPVISSLEIPYLYRLITYVSLTFPLILMVSGRTSV